MPKNVRGALANEFREGVRRDSSFVGKRARLSPGHLWNLPRDPTGTLCDYLCEFTARAGARLLRSYRLLVVSELADWHNCYEQQVCKLASINTGKICLWQERRDLHVPPHPITPLCSDSYSQEETLRLVVDLLVDITSHLVIARRDGIYHKIKFHHVKDSSE